DLSNANGLGAWFGFCFVYFTIVGFETNRTLSRLLSWLVSLGCLFVIGLTVSRGSLSAVALAIIVAFRRVLKRGFAPMLLLAILISAIYISGIFDRAVESYSERGVE